MPQHRYFLKDGTEVPGASTLSKIGDDQTGLKNASIRMALDKGLDSNIVWKRDTDIGTGVHRMIQQHLLGQSVTEPEVDGVPITDDLMRRTCWLCYRGWERWYAGSGFKAVETELSLVSERERFGGTFDAILEKNGILYVADWKTSKQFSHAMLIQIAGYRGLFNEDPLCALVHRGLIVRLSKDTGIALPRSYGSKSLDVGWKYILKQRDLHEGKKEVAKAFKEYGDE
jgi:hypothetical protein